MIHFDGIFTAKKFTDCQGHGATIITLVVRFGIGFANDTVKLLFSRFMNGTV